MLAYNAAIYVNFEHCWIFSMEKRKSHVMVQIKISSPGSSTRPHLRELARVVLIYLGIVGTFAVASLIACVIWLLIS